MAEEEQKLVEALDRYLSNYHSATKAFENLFGKNSIEVERICSCIVMPPPAVSKALGLANTERLHYRHVILKVQNIAISQAHNWFIARYLTKNMLAELEQTSKPFGSVVEALGFKRKRLERVFLPGSKTDDHVILQHTALLMLPDDMPFCFVEENYRQGLLNHLLRKSGDNGLRRHSAIAYL